MKRGVVAVLVQKGCELRSRRVVLVKLSESDTPVKTSTGKFGIKIQTRFELGAALVENRLLPFFASLYL